MSDRPWLKWALSSRGAAATFRVAAVALVTEVFGAG
jgi:hypothetical protein